MSSPVDPSKYLTFGTFLRVVVNTTTDRPGAAFLGSFFLDFLSPAFLGLRRPLIFKFHRVAVDFVPELPKKMEKFGLVQNPYRRARKLSKLDVL